MERFLQFKIMDLMKQPKEPFMKQLTYKCSVCGKEEIILAAEKAPVCCNMVMEPLAACTGPVSAEASRAGNADEPCDDGTTPKKKR
jgi:ribosomal protein S27E